MAVGQGTLTSVLDVGALDVVETRLEVLGVDACFWHGQLLRQVLELHRVLSAAGAGLSTVPQVALLLQLSESAAGALLGEGQLLASLPGGLPALDCGLLTVAQSAVLLRVVGPLDEPVQQAVWERLKARLVAAWDQGVLLTPGRLRSELARWVIATDPRSAEQRRRAAEAEGDVTYRRREDGLGDLFATGISGPVLQAVLCRIRERSAPFGSQDRRSAGRRRLDALLDLLLGRERLPGGGDEPRWHDGADGRCGDDGRTCGCHLGSPVPCGAQVVVHVPLGAALGTTDEPAELVGHGPTDPEQLRLLLLSSPRLQVVRVDAHGVPVAVDDRTWQVHRGDLPGLQRLLLQLADAPPGRTHPRHPFDHLGTDAGEGARAPAPGPGAAARAPGLGARARAPGACGPPIRAGAHPPELSGPYRLPRSLRRLLELRAPRCEWPGCGARSTLCDMDHDVPWPAGASCACQCGPLCRRHHRIKQLLMRKARTDDGAVTWTDPTGRSWTSPAQHPPPAAAVRPLPTAVPHALSPHALSPDALAELFAPADDDPVRWELRALESDPDEPDHDRLAHRLACDDGWGLALDDPYRWTA